MERKKTLYSISRRHRFDNYSLNGAEDFSCAVALTKYTFSMSGCNPKAKKAKQILYACWMALTFTRVDSYSNFQRLL